MGLSVDTSSNDRFSFGSYVECDGAVISPSRQNPKKAVHIAAHSMIKLILAGSPESIYFA